MATAKLEKIKRSIIQSFESNPKHVYRYSELFHKVDSDRLHWGMSRNVTRPDFLSFALSNTPLREIELQSRVGPSIKRYVWGSASPFEVAHSFRRGAYLSHASAVFLHALTERIPKTIYVNYEQSPKYQNSELTQESINKAFARKQRVSTFVLTYEDYQIVVLSGKNTGRHEVVSIQGSRQELLEVTSVERTLVDIVVRPAYAGGVHEVLEAFRTARDTASVNKIVAILKTLSHVYPYHQAIGFYMERAAYEPHRLSQLRELGMRFDFYMTHGMTAPSYDASWRLFYPQGL